MISASIISPILRVTTPILLCALGGVYSERSGTGNITYEGSMLMGTFTGVVGSYFSGSALVGVLCAILGGVFVNVFYGMLRLKMGGDNVVCGFAVNSFCVGATTYLLRTVFKTSGTLSDPRIQGLYKVRVPVLKDIPVIKYFFVNQTLLVYLTFILVILTSIILKRTKFGMNIRACGENPMAAAAVGVDVNKTRWMCIIITGVLCGLGGAQMALGNLTQFSEDMVGGQRLYRSGGRDSVPGHTLGGVLHGDLVRVRGGLRKPAAVDQYFVLSNPDDPLCCGDPDSGCFSRNA